jgi:hypothetical protein
MKDTECYAVLTVLEYFFSDWKWSMDKWPSDFVVTGEKRFADGKAARVCHVAPKTVQDCASLLVNLFDEIKKWEIQ